ncbi:aldolase [Georgenia halophila]|uniref:Aldolase n=1 Tax=Georgenia halophila TaxID=620889 RepID=A0ABP8LP21_9MICO
MTPATGPAGDPAGDLGAAGRAVVAAGRAAVAAGLSPGTSGNISVRDGDVVLMSPTGARLDALTADSLSVLGLDGEPVAGPAPSKERWLHRAMYRRDPAARAVVHVHSPYAAAASCLPPWSPTSALAPLTPYFVMRVGQTPLVPYAAPGDRRQADTLESLEVPLRAALLQNHGPVVAGVDLDAAVDSAVELEEAARLTVLLSPARPRTLTEGEVLELAERHGSPWTPSAGGHTS